MADRRRRTRLVAALALAALPPALAPVASAQGGVLLQGVADVELWKTDSASRLLARNGGRTGVVARADLWSAIEPVRDVVMFGELMEEAGSARQDSVTSELYLKRLGVRYSPSDAFVLEAGRVPQLLGTFSSRRLSFRNPLIGAPDGYAASYPLGARVDGVAGMLDYRVGMVSLPVTHEGYVPPPSEGWRPTAGLGITPAVGLRFGMSATVGPYLNQALSASLLAGKSWRDYAQRVVAADAQVSRGYFEGFAEVARGSYDVPGKPANAGWSGYVESKYTFTPRLFAALRVERNDYPFIAPLGTAQWISARSAFTDVEAGAGFRVTASSLFKATVRKDRWTPSPNYGAPQANGYAVAAQWSQSFDVVELMRVRR